MNPSLPPTILVTDQINIGDDLDWSSIAKIGKLVFCKDINGTEIIEMINRHRASIVISNRPQFDSNILKQAKSAGLQLLCLTATGTNTVDLQAARTTGIAVCNIRGYSTAAVAQHTFALALTLLNHTAQYDTLARNWHKQNDGGAWTNLSLPIHELAGKTWGILGLGSIGRAVAKLAEAFGCHIIWASATSTQRTEMWPQVNLETLLANSDVLSIHSPMTKDNKNLIGLKELSIMKRNAILLNTGRGGIVNESDLAQALTGSLIAGAALDVLAPEPPLANNPLFAIAGPSQGGNLLLSPHVAWAAVEARQRAIIETALNINDWLSAGQRNRVEINVDPFANRAQV